MKRFILGAIVALVMMAAAVGCNSSTIGTGQQAAGGAPYELIAVVAQPQWEGAVGETLKEIFSDPVMGLTEIQPRLDLMRVMPSAFEGFIKVHRNVLYINIDPTKSEVEFTGQQNLYADGQMLILLTAPNEDELIAYLWDNKEELIGTYERAERNRALRLNKRHKEGVMVDKIRDMFGFAIDLPRGYTSRGTSGDSLLVTSFEYPVATQGIAIYSYPYKGKSDFELENLVAQRNNFVKNIPGPSGKSHMTTVRQYGPEVSYKRIDGRFWAEMRGFWNLEGGDFMGGPMVSWSTVDTKTNRVVCIDCYVFSPKHGQRDLLRGLEHLIYSVEFPEDEVNDNK